MSIEERSWQERLANRKTVLGGTYPSWHLDEQAQHVQKGIQVQFDPVGGSQDHSNFELLVGEPIYPVTHRDRLFRLRNGEDFVLPNHNRELILNEGSISDILGIPQKHVLIPKRK